MTAAPRLLPDLLERGRDADTALVTATGEITHGDVRSRSGALAGYLHGRVRPGERVVIVLPNGTSFVLAVFAVWRAGGVIVPLDSRAPAERIVATAADCGAAALVCTRAVLARLAARLRSVPSVRCVLADGAGPEADAAEICVDAFDDAVQCEARASDNAGHPTDLVAIMYTSGSTGRPKGVMHSHESLLSGLVFSREHLSVQPTDRVLVAFPLYHLFAFRIVLFHLLAGAAVILEPDILAGLKRVRETRPNGLALVPAACALLVRSFPGVLAGCGSIIERLSIGSAAIAQPLLDEVAKLLPRARIDIPYGTSEARVAFLDPARGRPARRFVAVDPNLELSVIDERGQEVGAGMGELVLRGSGRMIGYWHETPGERERRRREGSHTGDLVERTAAGEYFLVGRLDDVIDVGGEKVFPLEIETVLLSHPLIRDVRVCGAADPRGVRGQVVKAIVASDAGLDAAAVTAHCRQRLEPYKVPQIVELVTAIARSEVGKVARRAVAGDGAEDEA